MPSSREIIKSAAKVASSAGKFSKLVNKYRGTIITIAFLAVVAFLVYHTLGLRKKLERQGKQSKRREKKARSKERKRKTTRDRKDSDSHDSDNSDKDAELDVSIRNYESHSSSGEEDEPTDRDHHSTHSPEDSEDSASDHETPKPAESVPKDAEPSKPEPEPEESREFSMAPLEKMCFEEGCDKKAMDDIDYCEDHQFGESDREDEI